MQASVVKIATILIFIKCLFNSIELIWGERLKKRFVFYSKQCISSQIIGFSFDTIPLRDKPKNNYWSLIEYSYLGEKHVKKIKRSNEDYVGRVVQIYRTNDEVDLRELNEFPYLDGNGVIHMFSPFIMLVVLYICFTR